MAYDPEIFSKHFGWHGEGMLRLHRAIRRGFKGQPSPVRREQWRTNSRLGNDPVALIALNFFLHNTVVDGENMVSVDELVLQAIGSTHSPVFDRLALFALNLNHGGKRKGARAGAPGVAQWANKFVREKLWHAGAWTPRALLPQRMDTFLRANLDATPDCVVKVRNNYRQLYELCGYQPEVFGDVDTGAEKWGIAAVFLKWDRLMLDGAVDSNTSLESFKRVALSAELHKLLGITVAAAQRMVEIAAPHYVDMRGMDAGRRIVLFQEIETTDAQLRKSRLKIQAKATPRYGDATERKQRQQILEVIKALQTRFKNFRPGHGAIGHNNPPVDESMAATQEAVAIIGVELEKDKPDPVAVTESTSRLQSILRWLANKADMAVDEFVKTLAKAGGIAVAAGLALWPFADHIGRLVSMVARWLAIVF